MNKPIGDEFINLKRAFENEINFDINKPTEVNLNELLPKIKKKKRTTNPIKNRGRRQNQYLKARKQKTSLLKPINLLQSSIKGSHKLLKIIDGKFLLIAMALFAAVKIIQKALTEGLVIGSLKIGSDFYDSSYAPSGTESTIMSTGKTSEQGIRDMLQYEGFIPVAKDVEGKGILTIGYGHRGRDVKPGQTITKEEAFKLFQSDLKSRENAVNKYVKVPITQNMFDALVSFVYNSGETNFKKSDTLKLLNQGKYKEAAQRMKTEYINKGTIHEKGLRNRRMKEANKILSDVDINGSLKQPTINPPVVKSTTAGKIRRFANGSNVGGYIMINPFKRNYIELSERAESYLRETGGRGIVTSGAEGDHASGKLSHETGNKIDVQGLRGKNTTNKEYAELCINFLKNPNTAFINLETFRIEDIRQIVEYIRQMDSTAYQLAQKATPYLPGKEKVIIYGKGKLLTSLWNPNHSRHLDIGILPNAYTKNQQKDNYNIQNKKSEEIKKQDQTFKPKQKKKTQSTNTTPNKPTNTKVKAQNKTKINTITPDYKQVQRSSQENKKRGN